MIEALDDLAARGVTSCTGADRAAMHEIAFRASPVKEVSLIDADGDTVCTNLALPFGHRQVISPPVQSAHSEIVIEVIRLGEASDNAVRVRRTIADGSWVAALVPADMLIPRISSTGAPSAVNATLATTGGVVIGERNADVRRKS